MLSMALMEDMVLDTMLMVMEILATLLLVMAMAMAIMDMESVKLRLNQRLMLMLSMALMEDMVLGMDMDIMVELSDKTNQHGITMIKSPPSMHDGPNFDCLGQRSALAHSDDIPNL